MKTSRISAYALGALLVSLSVSGCGPGTPFMTAEQEALMTNVDKLMKDNETLNRRLAVIEAGGGAEALKKEVASIRATVAGTNMEMEKLRHEFSFVRGSSDEAQHERDDIKGSISDLGARIKELNDKITRIEASGKTTTASIAELRSLIEATEARVSEIKTQVSSIEGRLNLAAPAEPARQAASPDDLYAKGYKETMNKDYAAAVETFKELLGAHPSHRYASNAQYWLAEIHYAKGEWEKAIVEFDKVKKNYPKSEKIAASTLKQGFAFERLGSKKEARLLLGEVIEKFPGTTEAELAKKKIDAIK